MVSNGLEKAGESSSYLLQVYAVGLCLCSKSYIIIMYKIQFLNGWLQAGFKA